MVFRTHQRDDDWENLFEQACRKLSIDTPQASKEKWRLLFEKKEGRHNVEQARPFHAIVFCLLREWARNPRSSGLDKLRVMWLVFWGIDACQRDYLWELEDDGLQLPLGNGEQMLVALWGWVSSSRGMAAFLESTCRYVSSSSNWLLARYALVDAVRLRWLTGRWQGMTVFLTMPLFAGIAIGWLMLLGADGAIRYIYLADDRQLMFSAVLVLAVDFVVLWQLGKNRHQGVSVRRVLSVFAVAVAASAGTGLGFLEVTGPQLVGSTEICCSILRGLWWSPTSVFVGIFTQMVWTGRAPTEIIPAPSD